MNSNDPAIYTSPIRAYFVRVVGLPTDDGFTVVLSQNLAGVDDAKYLRVRAAAFDSVDGLRAEGREPADDFPVAGYDLEYVGDLPRT
jgi:hypothetical protein